MNKHININRFCLWLLMIGTALPSIAQQGHITFFYGAPRDSMTKYFNAAHIQGYTFRDTDGNSQSFIPGYRWVSLNNQQRINVFNLMASPNMKRTFRAYQNSLSLRQKVTKTLTMSGGVVHANVYLVDDRNGLTDAQKDNMLFASSYNETDSVSYVWPAAFNWKLDNGRYSSVVGLGERSSIEIQTEPGGWKEWEATLLHELSHTQFLPDEQFGYNEFDSDGRSGVLIAYGGDQIHYSTELLGSKISAMDEGLATFWGVAHNTPDAPNALVAFLNRTDHKYYLDSWSFLYSEQALRDAPSDSRTFTGDDIPARFLRIYPERRTNGASIRINNYKWLDVPGKYVFYSEKMSTAYFYLLWKYGHRLDTKSFDWVFAAASSMAQPHSRRRYPSHAANKIALEMETYAATPQGTAEAGSGNLRSSLFAYAVFDLICHFDISEDDFKRLLRISAYHRGMIPNQPQAFTEYWNNHRANLRTAAFQHISPTSIDIEAAVQAMVDYCKQQNNILR